MTDDTKYIILFYSSILINILYFITFFGVVLIDETYVRQFSAIIQFTIAAVLVFRFNPFRSYTVLTGLDKYIIFSCGLFLLVNVFTTEIYVYFFKNTNLGILSTISKR